MNRRRAGAGPGSHPVAQIALALDRPPPPEVRVASERVGNPDMLAAWLAAWLGELPAALDRRAVVAIPSAALAHELRRHVAVTLARPGLLLGVSFVRPAALAAELLARAGRPAAAGQEPVRWLILRDLFARQTLTQELRYFAAEALASGRGYADAFARTLADCEAAGLAPADLERAADSLAGAEREAAGRLADVATVWRAVASEEDERRRTQSQLLNDAAALLADEPEIARGLGRVAAVIAGEPAPVLARFLASLPDAALVELAPGEHEDSARRQNGAEPALALYSSVAEEVDGAASWVVGEIARGTRLDELALVVPDVESYAPLLADRLARLAPLPLDRDAQDARPGIPIAVPEGRRALRSPAGRRLAALLHALERWLDAPAVIPLLPWLRPSDGSDPDDPGALRLTPSFALEIVYAAGIVGGREAPGDEWTGRLRRRAAVLRSELDEAAPPAEGAPERRRAVRDRRYAELHLAAIERIAPAMADLEAVAARIRSEATLGEIWPMVAGFGARWLKWPPDPPSLLGLAGHFLDPLLDHPSSARLTGPVALRFLAERLHAMRLAAGAPGRAAVTVTTATGAAGRRFTAVRVLGLAEGIVPRSPREDAILPGSLRRRIAGELGARLATPEDQVREDRRALDRVVGAGSRALVLTAPRQWLDRSEREVSGALLEIAARAGVAGGAALPTLAQFRARLIAGAIEDPTQAALARAVLPGAGRVGSGTPSASRAAAVGSGGRIGPMLAPEVIPGLSATKPISATALQLLLRCPYWFFLERMLGFHEPPQRPSVDAIEPLAFGSLVHAIAARFFAAQGGTFCAHEGRIEDWTRAIAQVAEREFELFLDRYPLRGRHAIERERRRVVTVSEQLVRHEWELGRREFVGAELPFGDPEAVRLDLPVGPLYVAGDIDRVDRFEDRGLEVRDLKTGRARDLSEEPLAIEPDLQIGLYATVLPLASGLPGGSSGTRVGAAAYVYPITERDPERRFAGEPLAHLLAWTGRWLEMARMLLASGDFVRTPRAADCRFCPFTAHCGEGAYAESARALADAATPELRAFAALKGEERA